MKGKAIFLLLFGLALALVSCGSAPAGEEGVGSKSQPLCSSVSMYPNASDYHATPGTPVLWTANSSCSGTAQYSFWVQAPNGTSTNPQPWSNSNTFTWNTTGLANGSYVVTVLVRENGSSAAYEAYQALYFVITSTQPCTTISTVPSRATAVVGQSVRFDSSASPCNPREFAVYHLAPGGSWQNISPYSQLNSSWTWDTTNEPGGTHYFYFMARAVGSDQFYQTYIYFGYNLQASAPCTSVSMYVTPTSPTTVGSPVTLHANALGCGSASYQYWYQTPGGAYQLIQDWTTGNSAVWNTNATAAGSYALTVLARSSTSTASYEAYYSQYHVLTAASSTAAQGIVGDVEHNCILTAAGKIACWGHNANGELGNGTTQNSFTPVSTGITTGVSLAVGESHACAALIGGAVKCWGWNSAGQLGNGSNTSASSPVSVSGLSSAISVGAGTAHSCAVLSDGTVKCWGYNSQGQLGDGTKVNRSTPVTVAGITNAQAVAAGYYYSCALLRDGTVKCWGLNDGGQLGDGTTNTSLTPVTVQGLTGVTQLRAKVGSNCALKSDHTIWCWGGNTQWGTLGDGSTANHSTPVQVANVTTATSVTINTYHGCASLQNGTAVCWGLNSEGQLGNNSTTNSLVPVPVANLTNVVSVGGSRYTSCAVLSDGTADCWGYSAEGEVGNGAQTNQLVPVPIGAIP